MAGHSHWHNIQRRKGSVDAKRGIMFSKLARNIIVAARNGGGDPDTNITLQYAIDKAKSVSMPRANIERAVKRGTGELGGAAYESIMYEAVAPAGVLILMEMLTDNRNRTAPEIRKLLEKKDAVMGSSAWAFEQRGLIMVAGEDVSEDELMDAILELGADDMVSVGDCFEVTTAAADMAKVRDALTEKGYTMESAEVAQVPTTSMSVDEDTARKVLSLLESLEEHDDVQNVYSNLDLSDELMEKLAAE
jgi:YebC/PmpR family DNA-binding regulatory protein